MPKICFDAKINQRAAPASGAIKHEKIRFSAALNATNEYRGDPRPEVDRAWARLLDAVNIRIDRHTLDRIGGAEDVQIGYVEVEDEYGGYAGALDVYHQLHCLQMIRISYTLDLYPGYQGALGLKEGEMIPLHIDHCIDAIRQALMCHGDITVLPMEWRDNYPKPWPIFDVEHSCVNWDSIKQWSRDHHLDETGKLTHPMFGKKLPSLTTPTKTNSIMSRPNRII